MKWKLCMESALTWQAFKQAIFDIIRNSNLFLYTFAMVSLMRELKFISKPSIELMSWKLSIYYLYASDPVNQYKNFFFVQPPKSRQKPWTDSCNSFSMQSFSFA